MLRRTDILGRVGGDEFALLLPETDIEIAKNVIPKIQSEVLDVMKNNNWPVTLSIGVLTVLKGSKDMKVMSQKADELMYSVKNSGKNGIAYEEFKEVTVP